MDSTGPLFVDTGRGLSVRYKDRWLYSSRAPLATPVEAALSAAMIPETLYYIPSPCLCHGLAELKGRLDPSSAILCVESDPALLGVAARAMEHSGLAGPPSVRVAIATPAEAVQAYRTLESALANGRFRRVAEVRLSGGRELDSAVYDKVLATISEDISNRFRNTLAMVRMGRLWARNVMANLAGMEWERVRRIGESDKPVVVCGAGPSLDRSFAVISRHREQLFVLACDTASGALRSAGIMPDAIVCLEAQIYNVADFLPLGRAETSHVIDLSSHPSSFRAVHGQITLIQSEWGASPFLSRLAGCGLPIAKVPALGSVGVLALHIARCMRLPILVAGLDFCFPPGRTHCSGSPADIREGITETRTNKRQASWNATFREGARLNDAGGIVDPALGMYAGLAGMELRDACAFDLRREPCAPLPIQILAPGSIDASINSIARDSKGSGVGYGSEAPGNPETWRESVRQFLRAESARVDGVAEMLRQGSEAGALRRALSEADILYAHFPDPERVLSLEHDALKRVAAEAGYWRGRFETAMELATS